MPSPRGRWQGGDSRCMKLDRRGARVNSSSSSSSSGSSSRLSRRSSRSSRSSRPMYALSLLTPSAAHFCRSGAPGPAVGALFNNWAAVGALFGVPSRGTF